MADWRDHISVDPGILVGKPVIAGTRISVEQILRKLAAGMTPEQIMQDFPRLTREDIRAALAYASDAVSAEELFVTGRS